MHEHAEGLQFEGTVLILDFFLMVLMQGRGRGGGGYITPQISRTYAKYG